MTETSRNQGPAQKQKIPTTALSQLAKQEKTNSALGFHLKEAMPLLQPGKFAGIGRSLNSPRVNSAER